VGTLIVTEFMTLDGVVEAPGGEPTHPSTLTELGWVMIGGGLTIFPQDWEKISLELADLVRYDSGVLLQIYRPTS
jgi:hypothetical protein